MSLCARAVVTIINVMIRPLVAVVLYYSHFRLTQPMIPNTISTQTPLEIISTQTHLLRTNEVQLLICYTARREILTEARSRPVWPTLLLSRTTLIKTCY